MFFSFFLVKRSCNGRDSVNSVKVLIFFDDKNKKVWEKVWEILLTRTIVLGGRISWDTVTLFTHEPTEPPHGDGLFGCIAQLKERICSHLQLESVPLSFNDGLYDPRSRSGWLLRRPSGRLPAAVHLGVERCIRASKQPNVWSNFTFFVCSSNEKCRNKTWFPISLHFVPVGFVGDKVRSTFCRSGVVKPP
jgi:hypothetical protein